MNILIIRVSAIGDVIHTLPALFYIKKSLPRANITWVVQQKAAALLKNQPAIDTLHVLPNGFLKMKNWKKTRQIVKELRRTKWDAIIDFQGLLKTSALVAPLSGKKFGFAKGHAREGISTWFTHHHTTPTYTNIIQKNLALASHVVSTLAQAITCPTISELQKEFALHVPEEKKQLVESWLEEHELRDAVVLCPNTTWPSKHWPLEHWQALVRLLDKSKIKTVLLGEQFGEQGAALAEYITQHNPTVAIAPPWDLVTVAYLLQKSSLLVAPDTGILHLADFLGCQSIGIFGPTLAAKHGPFLTTENKERAIQIPCKHAYQKTHGQTNCMKSLLPESLFAIIRRLK